MLEQDKLAHLERRKGFIAALDQSGGSTPSALRAYGIPDNTYQTKEEMFNLVHDLRMRIVMNDYFDGDYVLAAIIFKDTMERKIAGMYTAEYLWEKKQIPTILKVDAGLQHETDGVHLMKEIEDLDELLEKAKEHHVCGAKARSTISKANEKGIKAVVDQQFALAETIIENELVPVITPEVDVHSPEKAAAEKILKAYLIEKLDALETNIKVILKLSLPSEDNFYEELINHPKVMHVSALSGGYKQAEADRKLAANHGMIASFSRALAEGLSYQETDIEFDMALKESVSSIYKASIQ